MNGTKTTPPITSDTPNTPNAAIIFDLLQSLPADVLQDRADETPQDREQLDFVSDNKLNPL